MTHHPFGTCPSCGESRWTWQPADHDQPVMTWHQVHLPDGQRGDECPGSCQAPALERAA